MKTEMGTLSEAESGTVEDAVFAPLAIAQAEAIARSGEVDEEWIRPLVTAIRNRRLRIPVLSTTVHRIIGLIENPESSLDELAALVSQDPSLSARLMGVANSSFFRGATEVETVRDALMRMGMREARTIVIVLSLRSVVLRSPGQGDSATPFWRHSLLTAALAQEICAERPSWHNSGFLAGMTHDIGRLVIQAFVAELPAWREDGHAPDASVVDRMVAGLHCALGAHVLASWGFADAFCEGVLHHHDSAAAPAARPAELAGILDLANRMATQIEAGLPKSCDDLSDSIKLVGESIGYSPEMLGDLAAEAEASFEALIKMV